MCNILAHVDKKCDFSLFRLYAKALSRLTVAGWSLSETEVVQVGSFLINPLKPCTSVSADICKIPEKREITCMHVQVLLGGSFPSTKCLCTLQCSLSLLEWCWLGNKNKKVGQAAPSAVLSCECIMHWVYQAHTVNLRCLSNNWTFRFVWRLGGLLQRDRVI